MAARQGGASEIVVTDVSAPALATAAKVGADFALNVAEKPDALAAYTPHKGYFDMTFECSGNPRALLGALDVTRPLGAIVLVGLGGEATLPMPDLLWGRRGVARDFRGRGTRPIAALQTAKRGRIGGRRCCSRHTRGTHAECASVQPCLLAPSGDADRNYLTTTLPW